MPIISVEDAYDAAMKENLEPWQIFLGHINSQDWSAAQTFWNNMSSTDKYWSKLHIARLSTKHCSQYDRACEHVIGFAC